MEREHRLATGARRYLALAPVPAGRRRGLHRGLLALVRRRPRPPLQPQRGLGRPGHPRCRAACCGHWGHPPGHAGCTARARRRERLRCQRAGGRHRSGHLQAPQAEIGLRHPVLRSHRQGQGGLVRDTLVQWVHGQGCPRLRRGGGGSWSMNSPLVDRKASTAAARREAAASPKKSTSSASCAGAGMYPLVRSKQAHRRRQRDDGAMDGGPTF